MSDRPMRPDPALPHRLRLGMSAWMVLVVLLAVVPMLAYALTATTRLLQDYERREEVELQQRATAAAGAIRHRLDRVFAALEALAASDAAQTGDAAALYRQALRVMQFHPDAYAISLTDIDGQLIFNTLKAYGTRLPRAPLPDLDRAVIQQGVSLVMPMVGGPVSQRKVILLAVPVRVPGQPGYSLRMALTWEAIGAVLHEQQLPDEWTGTVLDQRRVVIGRTHEAERHVGQAAEPALREKLRVGAEVVFDSITVEGGRLRTCAVQVPGVDWFVVVGVPVAAFEAELRASLLPLLLAGMVCIALGVGGALYLAHAISRQVRQIAADSVRLAAGVDVPPRRSRVRELDDFSAAMHMSRGRETVAIDALQSARLDALTRLPARALFLEQAEALRSRLDSEARGSWLATLFIDLDGFKQANDRLGHGEGDRILRQVAEIVRQSVRAEDVSGRLGGDEFAVCLGAPQAAIEQISRSVAERIIGQVDALGDGIGCTIGIAFDHTGQALLPLLDRADQAMLQGKRAGKNRVLVGGMADAAA